MSKEAPDRAGQLAHRRQMLVLRSGQLRGQVVDQMKAVQPALVWADRLQDAWIWLRANPLAVATGVLALAVWRPRRSLGLALRAWSAWKLLQRARTVSSTASRLF